MYTLIPTGIFNFNEYARMFDLSSEDLSKSILSYPSSVTSFNAEASERGHQITSADHFYLDEKDATQQRAEQLFERQKRKLLSNRDYFLQHDINPDQLLIKWKNTIDHFIEDYQQGYRNGRYIKVASSPFPFEAHQFDIALCSALCFYEENNGHLSEADILRELLRVSKEVRIFPLLNEEGEVDEIWGPVMLYLQNNHFGQEVKAISFDEHNEENAMLRIWATECMVT